MYYDYSSGEETFAINTANLGEIKKIGYKFLDNSYVDVTIDLSNIERTIEVDDWQVNTDISGIGQEPSIPHRINLNNTYTDMSLNALSISTLLVVLPSMQTSRIELEPLP